MQRHSLRRTLLSLLGSLAVATLALSAFLAFDDRRHAVAFVLFGGGSAALTAVVLWLRSHGRNGLVFAVIVCVIWIILMFWLRFEAVTQRGERVIWPSMALVFGINTVLALRESFGLFRDKPAAEVNQTRTP